MTPRIYTRTGDAGDTGLFGGGRVPKHHPRVEAYGTVDELNAALGVAAAAISDDWVRECVTSAQPDLFVIGAVLATPPPAAGRRAPEVPGLDAGRVEELERAIDRAEAELPELKAFILPGGSPGGAALHLARTVCRRAERRVVGLVRAGGDADPERGTDGDPAGAVSTADAGGADAGTRGPPAHGVPDVVIVYLNRLSDLLFSLARLENHRAGRFEHEWTPGGRPGGPRGRPGDGG